MERTRVASGTEWEDQVGYSRAVRADNEVHVSGTTATDDGEIVGVDDASEQTRQALANIEDALDEADAALSDVVRTRIYVTDIDRWEAIGEAHSEAFDEHRPATSVVEVQRLIHAEMLVEIEAVAVAEDCSQ
jgi:enamine deaminase RidA (YjgF/YER057c/UK114 family)